MAVQSEASGLRSSRELGDERDFVKTDFVLVVYFIPPFPPFLLDSLKIQISLSYRYKVSYLKCAMPSSCHLLFQYNGDNEDLL